MKQRLEQVLQPLLGLTLWDSHRALELCMFDIGAERKVINRWGKEVALGEYSLHVSCPWRISDSAGIITGSDDRYVDDTITPLLEQDSSEATLLDVKIHMLWEQHDADRLCIERIEADRFGGVTLYLSKNYILALFPTTSDGEYWRILPPSEEDRHIVVSASGIEMD